MDLFFRKYGQGPAMIILHGLFGSSDNWNSVGKVLSESYEVYLTDARNHGNSPHSSEHSYMLLKNDLYEFMIARNLQKANIMGHSMGGKTAMYFAVDYPDRVQSLVIVDISPRSYKSADTPDMQSLEHMNIINAMLSVDFSGVRSRGDVDRFLTESIASSGVRHFLLKSLMREPDGSFRWKLNVNALRNNLPKIMDGIDIGRFETQGGITRFPVLFIKGEKSRYITEKDIPVIKTVFPEAEIVSIPDAGHWVHAEQPEKFMKVLKHFLTS